MDFNSLLTNPLAWIGFFILTGPITLAGAYYLLRKNQERQKAERDEIAMRRGWFHRTTREGGKHTIEFEGTTDGVTWRYQSVRSSSSTSGGSGSTSDYSRWFTRDVPLPIDSVFILPFGMGRSFPEAIDLNNPLVKMLIRTVFRGLGMNASSLPLNDMQHVDAGSDVFREHYSAFATDPALGAETVSQLEETLSQYAASMTSDGQIPLLILWPEGLYLTLDEPYRKPERLEQVIDLGIRLADDLT